MTGDVATIGIDLAAPPNGTGLCIIGWHSNGPVLIALARGSYEGATLDNRSILAALKGGAQNLSIAKAGIDAPFGWPDPFVKAVLDNHEGGGWPRESEVPRRQLMLRHTDHVIWDRTGKKPLSVSADKLGATAMRCAALLTEIGQVLGAKEVARDGSGLVCEVYPDPAVRRWTSDSPNGLGRRESYKGPKRGARRLELAKLLAKRAGLQDPDGLLKLCGLQDDYIDALLCALIARAADREKTFAAPTEPENERKMILREGWIHHPECMLSDLDDTRAAR